MGARNKETIMNRKNFLRNIALGIAMSLLPKVLQPIMSQIEEEIIEVQVKWRVVQFDAATGEYIDTGRQIPNGTLNMSRKECDSIQERLKV